MSLARAFGGTLFFSMPMLMTMEMWWLGFYMDRFRLSLFLLLTIPLLVGLSHFSGIRETERWKDDVADAGVAMAVGFASAAVFLSLFGVITLQMSLQEIVGKLSLQAVPASIGAMLSRSQLSGSEDEGGEQREDDQVNYAGEVFFMVIGAVFLAFNLAPTEEMLLIAYKMTYWSALGLILVSVVLMHAFVYAVEFRGSHRVPEGTPMWSLFARFTAVGYAVALVVSAYVLWTFGRFEENNAALFLMETVVLGFPASTGAAAARLIL